MDNQQLLTGPGPRLAALIDVDRELIGFDLPGPKARLETRLEASSTNGAP